MPKLNPNVCPRCGSSNTGDTFGFNPVRINADETLVHDVLYAALKRAKRQWDRRVGAHRAIEGSEYLSDVVLVDQAPIGRTPRSNPVTYLKAFDPIRELLAR